MEISKISTKGQVVIPKEIRDRAGLKEGDALLFKIAGNSIIIEKIENESGSMVDILKRGKEFPKHLVDELRKEW